MRTQEVQRRPEMQRSVGFHAGSPEVFGSHVKSAASDSQSLHMTSAVTRRIDPILHPGSSRG